MLKCIGNYCITLERVKTQPSGWSLLIGMIIMAISVFGSVMMYTMSIIGSILAILFILAGLFIWSILLIFGETLLPGKLTGFVVKLVFSINYHNYYYGVSEVVKIEDNTSKMANEIQKYVDEFKDKANELIQEDQQEQRTTISKEDIGINQLEKSIIARLKL
jgi:hypothetical protein